MGFCKQYPKFSRIFWPRNPTLSGTSFFVENLCFFTYLSFVWKVLLETRCSMVEPFLVGDVFPNVDAVKELLKEYNKTNYTAFTITTTIYFMFNVKAHPSTKWNHEESRRKVCCMCGKRPKEIRQLTSWNYENLKKYENENVDINDSHFSTGIWNTFQIF